MVMHGGDGEQRRNGRMLRIDATVTQYQYAASGAYGVRCVATERVHSWRERGRAARGAEDRRQGRDRQTGHRQRAKGAHGRRDQHWLVEPEVFGVLRRLVEQVRLRTEVHA